LCKQLFEESRYSYIYGQFIASAVLGFAFVERTLAAMQFAAGRNDLQRATSAQLFKEARNSGWLGEEDLKVFEKARERRNPLVHFRKSLHKDLLEWSSCTEECEPYEIVEADAKIILSAVFRLVARNAVG